MLSMEKTMVAMVISELKFISRLKIFRETEPWSLTHLGGGVNFRGVIQNSKPLDLLHQRFKSCVLVTPIFSCLSL